MDWSFVRASSVLLLINLVYAVVALFIGVLSIRLLDHLILKKIDLEEEIKAGIRARTLANEIVPVLGGSASTNAWRSPV